MVVDIVILALLKLGPKHGYNIKKHIEHILQRQTRMNTNLLYPALHRLEKSKAIEKKAEMQEGKPTKNIYRITSIGKDLLKESIEEFGEADASKEDEFLARLAFFSLIDERTQNQILSQRKTALKLKLKHRESMRTEYSGYIKSPWLQRIIDFRERQLIEEIKWIEELEKLSAKSWK